MHVAVDKTHRPAIEDEAQALARIEARLSAEGERLRSRPAAELWSIPSISRARRRTSAAKRTDRVSAVLRQRTGL